MDEVRFDDWTKRLIREYGSRRGLLHGLVAGGAGLLLDMAGYEEGEAKKGKGNKGKKGKKKAKPAGCGRGLVPCTPGSRSCCTPQSVISACKASVLHISCPDCLPGISTFCDFCLQTAAFEFFYCCDLYAISHGPNGVLTCMCNECGCCEDARRGESEIAIAEAMRRRR